LTNTFAEAHASSARLTTQWRGIASLLVWAVSVGPSNAFSQESERDLILFASVSAVDASGLSTGAVDDSDSTPSVGLMYTQAGERFRFHAELQVTDEEHEVERLQFGWQAGEATRVWLGRVHTPGSYWNTQYHHGQFLQTSIARPSIDAYEDGGGVLPMHLSGVLIEHRMEFSAGSAVQLEAAAGVSAQFVVDELETFDILDPESGFESSFDLRVDFLPDVLGSNLVGFSLGSFEIPISSLPSLSPIWDSGASSFAVDTFGVHGNWETDRWRLIASVRRVSVSTTGGLDSADRTFSSSYVHLERSISDRWKLFGRLEDTSGDESYLDLFPLYIREQVSLGLRFAIGNRHAITAELRESEAAVDSFHSIALQWSAAFL